MLPRSDYAEQVLLEHWCGVLRWSDAVRLLHRFGYTYQSVLRMLSRVRQLNGWQPYWDGIATLR